MIPHQYPGNVYAGSPAPHGSLPLGAGSPAPQSPEQGLMYDPPLSPPVSGSDTSEGLYHHSNSSGANSPSSSRANSLVHRSLRYHPTPSPTSSAGRRRSRSHHDSDDDNDMGVAYVENLAHSRKEATRRQRIEAEQRRRDELRDGYAKLKDVLPISNQKSSKVSLLERGSGTILASCLNLDLLLPSHSAYPATREGEEGHGGSDRRTRGGNAPLARRQRKDLPDHQQHSFPWSSPTGAP